MWRVPLPGELLGRRYRVLKLIGEGGMGAVLEAENTLAKKRVALKLLHPSLGANREAAERLVREAQACCRIHHPNVVEVYDVVHEDGALFLVMELIEGQALRAVIERGGLPAHEFIALVAQAMRGVAAAHAAGVIHRDIHPANILLGRGPDGAAEVPKVVDFGIAKLRDAQLDSLTSSGITMGTPLYMSYEQLISARDIDARTDIYPFGVILYQGITGRSPFEAHSLTELLVKFSSEVPLPPKRHCPDLPNALDRSIARALERDRDKRFPDMQAFLDELEPFTSARAFQAPRRSAQHTLPASVPRRGGQAAEPTSVAEHAGSGAAGSHGADADGPMARVDEPLRAEESAASRAPRRPKTKGPQRTRRTALVAIALIACAAAASYGLSARSGPSAGSQRDRRPPPLPSVAVERDGPSTGAEDWALPSAAPAAGAEPISPGADVAREPDEPGPRPSASTSTASLPPSPALDSSTARPQAPSAPAKAAEAPWPRRRFRAGVARPSDF